MIAPSDMPTPTIATPPASKNSSHTQQQRSVSGAWSVHTGRGVRVSPALRILFFGGGGDGEGGNGAGGDGGGGLAIKHDSLHTDSIRRAVSVSGEVQRPWAAHTAHLASRSVRHSTLKQGGGGGGGWGGFVLRTTTMGVGVGGGGGEEWKCCGTPPPAPLPPIPYPLPWIMAVGGGGERLGGGGGLG